MKAEIIAVGTELLTPSRLDTNSLFITRRLNESGLRVMRKFVVGDRGEEIRRTLETALHDSEVVIITGGLGPTHDDMTREDDSAGCKKGKNQSRPWRPPGRRRDKEIPCGSWKDGSNEVIVMGLRDSDRADFSRHDLFGDSIR